MADPLTDPEPRDVVVRPWLEDDDSGWDAVCDRHDDLFQTAAATRAAEVFGAVTRRIRVEDAEGRPLAAVALLEIGSRKLPAADVLVRRFQVRGGPLSLGDDPGAAAAGLAGVEAFAAERGATETDWKPTWPAAGERLGLEQGGFRVERFGVAWRDLPEDPKDVLPTLSRVHRKAVRRALDAGVRVRDARDAAEVLPLVDASFVRSGLPERNRQYLDTLYRGLDEAGRVTALVAEDSSGPLAALFAGRCGGTVFNLFHGRVDGDTRGASNLLHLRLFERAVEAGARRIHTGDAALPEDPGAEADGIRRFKLHLGFRVDPCTRGVRVHRPLPRKIGRAVLGAYRFLRGGGE